MGINTINNILIERKNIISRAGVKITKTTEKNGIITNKKILSIKWKKRWLSSQSNNQ